MSSIYNGGCGSGGGGTTNVTYQVTVSGGVPNDTVFAEYTFTNVGISGAGVFVGLSAKEAQFARIEGGENVQVKLSANMIKIDVDIAQLEALTEASAVALIEGYGYITRTSADGAYLSSETVLFTEASADAKFITQASADAAYLSAGTVFEAAGISQASAESLIESYGYITQASADAAYLSSGTVLYTEASADGKYLALSNVTATVSGNITLSNNLTVGGEFFAQNFTSVSPAGSFMQFSGGTQGLNVLTANSEGVSFNDTGQAGTLDLGGLSPFAVTFVGGTTGELFIRGLNWSVSAPSEGDVFTYVGTNTISWRAPFTEASADSKYLTPGSADTAYLSSGTVLFSEGSADAKYLTPASADTAYLSAGQVLFSEGSADAKYISLSAPVLGGALDTAGFAIRNNSGDFIEFSDRITTTINQSNNFAAVFTNVSNSGGALRIRAGDGVNTAPLFSMTDKDATVSLFRIGIDGRFSTRWYDLPTSAGTAGQMLTVTSGTQTDWVSPFTEASADSKYAQLATENTFTQPQTISSDVPILILIENDQPVSSNALWIALDGGTLQFQRRDSAGVFITQDAIVERAGTSIATNRAVITAEKGDARYVQLSASNTLTGSNTFTGFQGLRVETDSFPRWVVRNNGAPVDRKAWQGFVDDTSQAFILNSINDAENASTGAFFFERDGAATFGDSVVRRDAADTRYARLSAPNVFTQPITIAAPDPILLFDDTSDAAPEARRWYFTNSNGVITLNRQTAAGDYINQPARFDDAGNSLPTPQTVVTREKGDGRYTLAVSDFNLKTNISAMPSVVSAFMNLNPVTFEWAEVSGVGENGLDSIGEPGVMRWGLIAQSAASVFDGIQVSGDWVGLDVLSLVGITIKAVQETRIELETYYITEASVDSLPVSHFNNDIGYITEASSQSLIEGYGYITEETATSVISQLFNDVGYVTEASAESLIESYGYITEASAQTLVDEARTVFQDEGVALPATTNTVNFIGANVTTVYNNDVANVTIGGPERYTFRVNFDASGEVDSVTTVEDLPAGWSLSSNDQNNVFINHTVGRRPVVTYYHGFTVNDKYRSIGGFGSQMYTSWDPATETTQFRIYFLSASRALSEANGHVLIELYF